MRWISRADIGCLPNGMGLIACSLRTNFVAQIISWHHNQKNEDAWLLAYNRMKNAFHSSAARKKNQGSLNGTKAHQISLSFQGIFRAYALSRNAKEIQGEKNWEKQLKGEMSQHCKFNPIVSMMGIEFILGTVEELLLLQRTSHLSAIAALKWRNDYNCAIFTRSDKNRSRKLSASDDDASIQRTLKLNFQTFSGRYPGVRYGAERGKKNFPKRNPAFRHFPLVLRLYGAGHVTFFYRPFTLLLCLRSVKYFWLVLTQQFRSFTIYSLSKFHFYGVFTNANESKMLHAVGISFLSCRFNCWRVTILFEERLLLSFFFPIIRW